MGTRVGLRRSCGAYWELRRLTMRGDRLFSVLVACRLALASSSSRNQRRARLGCSGGKGPGSGLCAAQELYVALEGQLCV